MKRDRIRSWAARACAAATCLQFVLSGTAYAQAAPAAAAPPPAAAAARCPRRHPSCCHLPPLPPDPSPRRLR